MNKMVYFMLAVAAFVIASFMTGTDLAATGETAGTEAVTGDVLSIVENPDGPSLKIRTEHGEIEIRVNDNTLISVTEPLKGIKEGDNIAVRYSAIDIQNLATDITIIQAKKK